MARSENYYASAREDAEEMAREFLPQLVAHWEESGEVVTDWANDLPGADEYHHENNVGNKEYGLAEAEKLLGDLDEWEETDDGLWEGLAPRQAISAQAAYTYGNAVGGMFRNVLKEWERALGCFSWDDEPERKRDGRAYLTVQVLVGLHDWTEGSELWVGSREVLKGAEELNWSAALIFCDRLEDAGRTGDASALRAALALDEPEAD